jgi:hypothetical protein
MNRIVHIYGLTPLTFDVKTIKQIAGFSIVLLAVLSAQAQGTFENLNFEQADPISAGVPGEPFFVTAASALPYWNVYYDGVQQTQIPFNAISYGTPSVSLLGTAETVGISPIDGNYSVLLQPYAGAVSISQTGLIPANTPSLLFEGLGEIGVLEVLVGTQIVPFTAVETEPTYTLYGANISAWEGQNEQLTFSALGLTPTSWEIDDISFSTTPEPEPNILALTAIGGLLFGARKWFARR